jgi:hypothetical protein
MLILTSNAEDAGPELGKLVEPLAPLLGRQPFTQLAGGKALPIEGPSVIIPSRCS